MISIIMPVYNREKTVSRAINSVLNQTYKDIELIIVNDNSTDNTEKIIKGINDSRIKYFKLEENHGACYARNFGIKKASGEYIAFQDSDDEFLPEKMNQQLKKLIKTNSDLNFCKIKSIDDETGKYKYTPSNKIINTIIQKGYDWSLTRGNFISTQSIVAKKSVFDKNMFDEELPRLQEYDLIMRIVNKYKFSYTNNHLVNVYIQSDSISKNEKKLVTAIQIMQKKEYNLNKKDNEYFKNVYLNNLAGNEFFRIKNKKCITYYRKSIKNSFDFKILLKFLIAHFFNKN